MIDPGDMIDRHRSARLVAEVTRPASAAVLAQLPARPGASVEARRAQESAGLETRAFWTAVSRLETVGVIGREASGGLALDRDRVDSTLRRWVADSPLVAITEARPRLRPFVEWGRCVRSPTEPALIEELYEALAELFESGEELSEPQVNDRILVVHDDPAEIRRGLVDRGLLTRAIGTGVYRRP